MALLEADQMVDRLIGRFLIREELLNEVRGHMETVLGDGISITEAESFLYAHTDLLGSIVAYDEVDTTDRARIWEYCKSWL